MWRKPKREWDERHQVEILQAADPVEVELPDVGDRARLIVGPEDGATFPTDGLLLRRDHGTLLVVLHGALDRTRTDLPRFEWLRTLSARPENLLFLADTSLSVDPDLGIGWFIGTAQDDLVATMSASVRTLAERLGCTRTVVTGSSAGGFGSLAIAARVPGALAVPFSPQTRIGAYYPKHVARFTDALFPDYPDYDAVERAHPDRLDLTGVYGRAPDAAVWYVQNLGDSVHRTRQLTPFAKAVGAPVRGGDSASGSVHVELVQMGKGHVPPPRDVMTTHLDAALAWSSQRG